MKTLLNITICSLILGHTTLAQAQVGRLVKEGLEAAGKQAFKKTAREAVEEGAERVLKKVVAEAGQETAETIAKRAGITAARYTDDIAKVVGKHGGAVAAPLVNTFGDNGAKALTKLSSTNARRMAMLTDDLAATGQGADWMRILADKGDVAADWIWKNQASLAVAATATAFIANPDPFLQAGETVITKSIETAGEHIAEPLIEQTAEHVMPSLVKEISHIVTAPIASIATRSWQYPGIMLVVVGIFGGGGFVAYRWYLHPLLSLK